MDRLGTDPGFFVDDDGKVCLICSEKATIWQLSADGLSVERTVTRINKEGIAIFEGPDIFKHNGYYYLVYSANGTAPHEGGQIGTMRARRLEGPWKRDPNNPQLLTQPQAEIQGPQHATLLQTQTGQWFVVYHAHDLSYYSLGRQMYMQPIVWTEDGWWRPKNGRIPTRVNKKPDLPYCNFKLAQSDEFDSDKLGLQWFFHCKPDFTGWSWSLTERPGFLRIKTRPGDISSLESLPNVFLQRVINKHFEFTTRVSFDARDGREAAGLHMYHDPQMNFWLVTTVRDAEKTIEVGKYNNGERKDLYATANPIGNTVHLRIKVDGTEHATFYCSPDETAWQQLGGTIHFGDSGKDLRDGQKGDPDLGWIGSVGRNKWTATTFGVFAVRDGAAQPRNADFDYFRVRQFDGPRQ